MTVVDVAPFDVADEVQRRVFELLVGLLRELVALALFFAHGEQADPRLYDAEDVTRIDVTHHRELEQVPRLGIDVGSDVEENRETLEVRQHRRDGGPIDPTQDAHDEHRNGQGGAGVAGGDERARLAVPHELGGHAQR